MPDVTVHLTDEEYRAAVELVQWSGISSNPAEVFRLLAQLAAIEPIKARMHLLDIQDRLARPRPTERTYQQARGLVSGGEPAEVIQRRMRGTEPPGD